MSEPAHGNEVHVAGVLVHAHPEAASKLAQTIAAFPGAQVHAVSREGKLVITLEGPTADAITGGLDRMQTLDGVLAASLVYQHSEGAAAMDEEVEVEDHAQAIR